MTQYREHFENSDIGANPPTGFTQRWGAAAGGPGDFTQTVANGTPVFKRKVLVTAQGVGITTYGLISLDAVDGDSDRDNVQALACYEVSGGTPDDAVGLVFRASGSSGLETGYIASIRMATNQIILFKFVAGAPTAMNSDSYTFAPGDKVMIRAEVQGNDIRMKAWPAGNSEPSDWMIVKTDSDVTAAGWVGFWNFGASGNGTWEFLTVGTNGDTAPTPVLNSEYSQWLANGSNPRVVLADLSAVGSIPAGMGSPAVYDTTIHAYAATAGFTTKSYDTPASTHYPAIIDSVPNLRREMPSEFTGKVSTGFGSLVVSNGRPGGSNQDAPGIRDEWLRMRWKKELVTLWLGDPSWSKHDFRKVLVGKLGQPTAPAETKINFPIEDLSGLFDVPVTNDRFASGPYEGQYEPRLFGLLGSNQIEPPLVDTASLEYFVGTESDGDFTGEARGVLDEQVPIDNGLADTDLRISAVDTGTEVITVDANHGFAVNWRVRFKEDPDPPPAPLMADTDYWIESIPAPNQFTVSATRGGAAINLTATDTNALVYGWGWDYDPVTSLITLASNPAGRVTARSVFARTVSGIFSTDKVYDQIVFRAHGLGLSENYKDTDSFTALGALTTTQGALGLWTDTTQTTVAQLLQRLAAGTFTWFGLTPDGLFQVGQLGLPASTSVMDFIESDVKDGSLKLVQVIRPKNFATAQVSWSPWFLTGPQFASSDPTIQQGRLFLSPYTYAGSVPPLDNDPTLSDTEENVKVDLLTVATAAGLRNHLADFYALPLGVFEFQTTLRATELSIGQTIQLEHSRMDWREWAGSGDDPSPDNTDPADSTKAVVLAIDTSFAADGNGVFEPFPVKLKVLRPIVGYYPEEDIAA